jgi:pseudomonalisin
MNAGAMVRAALVLASAAALTACGGGGGQRALPPAAAASDGKSANAVAVPPGWSQTATRGAAVVHALDAGPLAPATRLTVRLGLSLRNATALESLIRTHHKLRRAEFEARFAPAPSDVQAVVAYLKAQGFTNVTAGNQLVSADGTAGLAASAFHTTLEAFRLGGTTLYANTTPAFVPESLHGAVSAVLGLNDAAKMTINARTQRLACFQATLPTGQCAPLFEAQDVQRFYDVGSTADATQTSMAVMAAGDMTQVISDLRFAENAQGLPQVPLTLVTVGTASTDRSNSLEWDLDTQSSTGMAQNTAAFVLYATASLSDADIAQEYDAWAVPGGAAVASSSFGECESQAYLDGSMQVDDNLLMTAASLGKTMFVASGDTGAACTLSATGQSGPPEVEYPASSPYVVAVGGTTATANGDGSYAGEAAWTGGGGGVSAFENAPSWQQGITPAATGVTPANVRGVPDVAMAADPSSGAYRVYGANVPGAGDCSGGCAVGGTSEASPLAMGAYARILSAHVDEIGFAPPLLYAEFRQRQAGATAVVGPPPTRSLGGFHDILTGTNGAYTALPGYDYTTGLGSFEVSVMNAQIAN